MAYSYIYERRRNKRAGKLIQKINRWSILGRTSISKKKKVPINAMLEWMPNLYQQM
jgi:hypothetical protein